MKYLFNKEGVPPLTIAKASVGLVRRDDTKGPHRQGHILKVWAECSHGLACAAMRVRSSVDTHINTGRLLGDTLKAKVLHAAKGAL